MSAIAKPVEIPQNARIKSYYDTVDIVQNTATYNFFPANATRKVTRDNYFNNPFPGTKRRLVFGLSFETVQHFISDATDIDSEKIVNALKDASVTITADNDNKEFLQTTIEEHSNFAGTGLVAAASKAWIDGAVVTEERKTVVVKGSNMYRLQDPFIVAANQTLDVKVRFKNAADFPTAQQWTDASQPQLRLRCTLYLAELPSSD